jgi:hypothetical protein
VDTSDLNFSKVPADGGGGKCRKGCVKWVAASF